MKRLFLFVIVTALVGMVSVANANTLPTEHDGTTGGSSGPDLVMGDECGCITVGCPYGCTDWNTGSGHEFAPPAAHGSALSEDSPPTSAGVEMCCRDGGTNILTRILQSLQGWIQ